MNRALAFELPLLWAGQVETEPGAVSGWHHHERNESSLYIVRGVLRLEFEGHDGYIDAGPGDFVHVPAWTVHRESNPSHEPSFAVIARVGGGIPTVNVDGPSGADARTRRSEPPPQSSMRRTIRPTGWPDMRCRIACGAWLKG